MRIRSIKFIVTAFIFILGVITIFVFGIFSFNYTKIHIEMLYSNESEIVLKHTMLSFKNQLDNAENILNLSSQTELIKSINSNKSAPDINTLLNLLGKTVPNSCGLTLGLDDGRTYWDQNKQIPSSYDPRKRNWYLLAKKSKGEIIWTEPYLDYMTQNIIITAAKTVNGISGKDLGVIAINLDVSLISKLISNSKIGTNGFVMLLSRNGTVVANRNDYMIGENIFNGNLQDIIKAKNSGVKEYLIKGEEYYLKFQKLENNGMFLVTAINKKEIYNNLKNSFLPVTIVGILCLLAFGILAYFLALKGITPLEKLVDLMKSAEKGNYNIFAKIHDYEEIESLGKSFNNMIEGIRKRDDKLLAANSELRSTEEKLREQYYKMELSQEILVASEQKIKHLAYYDSLTGLANRQNIIEALKLSIKKASNLDSSLVVMYIDLDNFKTINDTMGHSIGDKVLIKIASRLNELNYNEKVVGRIGGDEFIILLKNIDSMDIITDISKDVVNTIAEPLMIDSRHFNIMASIGIAIYHKHGKTAEELLMKADMAMYKAKSTGKNDYKIFDDSMQSDLISKVNIEDGIRQALINDEFVLYYQPLYSISENKICSVEALLRCNSPLLKNVSTEVIIKIAEESALILKIEKWVLKNACLFAKKINENNNDIVKVSVNISAVHIMQSDFAEEVRSIMDEVGVNPKFLGFEITETVMMESFSLANEKLEKLKTYGIDLHLDDFGSGYSSLNYIQKLPINYVKIDKLFVDTMVNSERDSKIIATIIELVHNIGLKVVAEGVEDKEQYDLLMKYNCDIIQGYYINKPMPINEMLQLLTM